MSHRIAYALVLAMLASAPAFSQPVAYVDDDAPPGGDGQSWATAFNDLQPALAAAGNPAITEIRVAGGTYKPTAQSAPGAPRTATFALLSGVAIRGGYRGLTGGGAADHRNIAAFTTVLSGDIGVAGDETDNAYHVVTGSGTDATAVLDGVTVTAGFASAPAPANHGGGVYNDAGSPTLIDCTITGNSAFADYGSGRSSRGGGMYNANNSRPTLIRCIVSDNTAVTDAVWGGGGGGGIYNVGSSPTLDRCVFTGNLAVGYGYADGGGILNENNSHPKLVRCTFSENLCESSGGGMCSLHDCHPTLTGCDFVNNASFFNGGGMNAVFDCSSVLFNCRFIGNTAYEDGGGMASAWSNVALTNSTFAVNDSWEFGGAMDCGRGTATLRNCLLVRNRAANGARAMFVWQGGATLANCITRGHRPPDPSGYDVFMYPSNFTITYSCIEGGWPGAGNIDVDPLFVDADGADNVLGTLDDDYRLRSGSPCIDAGDNAAVPADVADLDADGDVAEATPWDLQGFPRFRDDLGTVDTGSGTAPLVDMGAHEYFAARPWVRSADLDADGDVDLVDFALFVRQYTGSASSPCLFVDNFEGEPSAALGGGWIEAERAGTRENGHVVLAAEACMGYALLTAGANPPGHDDDEPMAWMAIGGLDVLAHGGISLSYDWAGHGDVSGGFDRLWVEWKACGAPEWPEFAVFDSAYPPDGVVVHGIRSHELTEASRGVFTSVQIADLDVSGASCVDIRFRVTASQPGEGAAVDNVRICGKASP